MSNRVDLTGTLHGDFFIKEYLGKKQYLLVCTLCGETKTMYTANIKKGFGKNCSYKKVEIDLVGQQIGEWTVLEYLGKKKYKCRCSCGTIKDVLKVNLINGTSTSCGHLKQSYGDLTGKRIGEWTVLEKSGYKWKCQCSCGKIGYNMARDMISGRSKSCGHGYNTFESISGKQFGEWTVGNYIGNQYYECKCSCGNVRNIRKADLLSGATTSCGCLKSVKIKEKLYEKYGDISPNRSRNPRNFDQIQAVLCRENLESFINKLGYKPSSMELSRELGLKLHRTLTLVHKYELDDKITLNSHVSQAEKDIYNYIKSIYKGEIEQSNRKVISPQELDIYIPEKKIAIEFNGNYWHSDIYKDKNYHQQKTFDCAKAGIRLIHIFEYEWNKNEERIKQYLRNMILDKNVIYARETEIKEINKIESSEFFEKYHIQGNQGAEIYIGLLHNNEIISVMTFGKPRFNNKYQYELIRYATKHGITIVGGAERLFKYFINNYKPNNILTYTDISKFTGNIYTKLGFKVINISDPNYVWVSFDENNVLSRYQTQKHKLIELNLGTEDQTETEIMESNDYYKVYDCGNLVLEYNI